MRTVFLTLVGVAGLTAGTQAMSLAPQAAIVGVTTPGVVTQVADGCGPGRFRGPYGGCRPYGYGRQPGRYACPPGYHLGPMGGRCFPNR